MRQSEDHMIVWNGQQLAFPIDDPSFPVGHLALWAMAVAAGVVTDRLYPTRRAYSYMTSQDLSPTQGQGLEGFPDLCYRIKLLFESRTMKMDNVANFMFRPQRV